MDFIDISTLIAAFCYLFATASILSKLFDSKGPNHLVVLLLACIAIVPHTLLTTNALFVDGAINFNLPNVVTLVSVVITMLITATAVKYQLNLLQPAAYGFASIWLFISFFLPDVAHIPLAVTQATVLSHITLSLIAYCVLIIACLYGFQVAYINMKLKSKNLAAVNHLPPLMLVERQLFTILAVGTIALAATNLTGFIFLDGLFNTDNAHKTVLSLLALLIYSIILWGHFKNGWRGHRVLTLTLVATALLTLSYFGSRFVKEFLLS
ncbi:cytochrome C assembly family protein [Thalassotalea euphylliae]|uniref:Cytochrome C assembly family protein n=1 Tax=Thalassotalea euphylliae TaxID=1655234 RepID=A0A3E0UC82_9GAMM|nr:cytochrome c biogenesis protein CcsA [Thalassotalea euphylliae]REL34621.1 cytochrome C assembly family protein [Thalassotalea euphylliae]